MVVTILGILIVLAAFLSLIGIGLGEHYLRYDNGNYQYLGSLICRVSGIVLFVTCISVAMIDARYDSSKVFCIFVIVACVSAGAFGLTEFIRGSNIANILLEEFADYEEEEEEKEEEETLGRAENVDIDATENVDTVFAENVELEVQSDDLIRECIKILIELDALEESINSTLASLEEEEESQ